MRILQVSNRVPWPLNEGGTIGIYNFTKAFFLCQQQVVLYCTDPRKHRTAGSHAYLELNKFASVRLLPIDTDITIEDALRNILSNESFNVSRFYSKLFEDELEKLLMNQTFDLVQMEGTYTGPYLKIIRKYHKGLVSMRMHNVEHQIWQRLARNEWKPLKKLYLMFLAYRLRKYEKRLVNQVDHVIPVTPDDDRVFKSLYPQIKSLVIPAGIDTDNWQYKPTGGFQYWYHLGSLEWMPNQDAVRWFVKEVFPKLSRLDPSFSFHLGGKKIQPEIYPEKKGLIIYPEVKDATSFSAALDVCVVPLRSGSGIRVKILEAMSAGKLVISSTIGAQGIAYENGKNILIADTAKDYVRIYKALLAGKINVNAIVASARKLIDEEYSILSLTRKLLDYYEENRSDSRD